MYIVRSIDALLLEWKNGSSLKPPGGLLDDEGKLKGSVLIMEFQNREELDQYLAREIYVTEHVWEKITVERMNVVYAHRERVGK